MEKTKIVLDYYSLIEKGAKRNAAQNIKRLLAQLDESAERIPENNYETLNKLITFLKGADLNEDEIEIVRKISNT